jgi:hypothetical protein
MAITFSRSCVYASGDALDIEWRNWELKNRQTLKREQSSVSTGTEKSVLGER